MAGLQCLKLSYVLFVLCVLRISASHASDQERKIYIVFMGHTGDKEQTSSIYHSNMLQEIVDSRFQGQSLIRSYGRSFNGFAAHLTHEEKEKLASREEVVSIFPSIALELQTTRSWDFMGLRLNASRKPIIESDTIVGIIDSGIWPETESFSDKGFGPPPKKWKGVCKGGKNFTCNNKLIGARYYNAFAPSETDSARDTQGHGSHTASTAAGNTVKDTSFYGIAKGTARGGVPSARIAVYKACFSACQTADVLGAFDDAIADGVDILSVSLGMPNPIPLDTDPIAVASFFATQKGILVVQSAGNTGQQPVSSTTPWIFTVAASTTDSSIISKVVLGNGTAIAGKAVNAFDLKGKSFPLAYGKEVSKTSCSPLSAKSCVDNCLDNSKVKGKVVLCDSFGGSIEALRAEAVGSVLLQSNLPDTSFVVPLAASSLSIPHFHDLEVYINSTKNRTVDILKSEVVKNHDAPRVASFSSRGPNLLFPNILKPDVTAPGVEILAAFSPFASPSEITADTRSVKYSILSGTSMSCPHVTGAAAYVKTFHPRWSPSAIKSALMTTAWRMNFTKDPKAEFSYGTGHIDPVKATDPGLVYQISTNDYSNFLCTSGLDATMLRRMLNIKCSDLKKSTSNHLNYPAMTFRVDGENAAFSARFRRTVTNVGTAKSTYKVITSRSLDYNITVNPSILKFRRIHQKHSFVVTISGKIASQTKLLSALLEWSDGVHSVRSPIVVYS